jgi:hypothetical protein
VATAEYTACGSEWDISIEGGFWDNSAGDGEGREVFVQGGEAWVGCGSL